MKPWKVIAYHTDDYIYNKCIADLRASLEKFDISYAIKTIPKQPTWRETHLYMHKEIRKAFDLYPENLVYLDADAVVRQYPALFDTIKEDIAVHYRNGIELLAGTTYMKNSDKGRELFDRWAKRSYEVKHIMSGQTGLADVLESGDFSVYRLPAPYTLIFDIMRKQGPPVIEHFQASRRARKLFG